MITPVEITNGTIHVIVQQAQDSPFTIILAISTLVLALITGIGLWRTLLATGHSNRELIISNELTRDSNKLLETQLENTMRPLFEFSRFATEYQNVGTPNLVCRIYLTLKNSGIVPARKIIAYYKETGSERIEDIVREKDTIWQQCKAIGTIQQNGHHEFLIDTKWDPPNKPSTKFVIWFDYTYLNKKEQALIWCELTGGQNFILHKWYVYDDIKEAEERNRNPPTAPT